MFSDWDDDAEDSLPPPSSAYWICEDDDDAGWAPNTPHSDSLWDSTPDEPTEDDDATP